LSIIDSIVYGIGTLPEAEIRPVKRMPKKEKDSCRLYALAFNSGAGGAGIISLPLLLRALQET